MQLVTNDARAQVYRTPAGLLTLPKAPGASHVDIESALASAVASLGQLHDHVAATKKSGAVSLSASQKAEGLLRKARSDVAQITGRAVHLEDTARLRPVRSAAELAARELNKNLDSVRTELMSWPR